MSPVSHILKGHRTHMDGLLIKLALIVRIAMTMESLLSDL